MLLKKKLRYRSSNVIMNDNKEANYIEVFEVASYIVFPDILVSL